MVVNNEAIWSTIGQLNFNQAGQLLFESTLASRSRVHSRPDADPRSLHNRRTQDHFFPKELSIDRPFGTKYLWADSNGDKSVLKVARFLLPPKVRLDSTFRCGHGEGEDGHRPQQENHILSFLDLADKAAFVGIEWILDPTVKPRWAALKPCCSGNKFLHHGPCWDLWFLLFLVRS